MKKDKVFTEKQIREALRNAIVDCNKELLSSRSDMDKLVMNKFILGFVGKILKNLNVDYTN